MKSVRIFLALNAVAIAFLAAAIAASQQGTSAGPGPVTPQLVIIDTDIGDDIDDAFALALALKSPELKILGVTTTFGNTEMRARLLDRYLQAVGRSDIPVLAGPMTKTDNVMTQAAYAKQVPERKHGDGAEFILRAARQHPGQVTLIGDRAAVHGAGGDRARPGCVQEAEARGDHGRQRLSRLRHGRAGQAESRPSRSGTF